MGFYEIINRRDEPLLCVLNLRLTCVPNTKFKLSNYFILDTLITDLHDEKVYVGKLFEIPTTHVEAVEIRGKRILKAAWHYGNRYSGRIADYLQWLFAYLYSRNYVVVYTRYINYHMSIERGVIYEQGVFDATGTGVG